MREMVPRRLTADGPRVVRPRDLTDIWALPHKELARLADRGVCRAIAHGYWLLLPLEEWGNPRWRPGVEALGASLAAADFGRDNVAVVKLSAARMLGVLPRARSVADVACPIRRHPTVTEDGIVRFPPRNVKLLDVQVTQTELGKAWVTTAEQTLVDIAADVHPADSGSDNWIAATALAREADWELVRNLASQQRKKSAVHRLRQALGLVDVVGS